MGWGGWVGGWGCMRSNMGVTWAPAGTCLEPMASLSFFPAGGGPRRAPAHRVLWAAAHGIHRHRLWGRARARAERADPQGARRLGWRPGAPPEGGRGGGGAPPRHPTLLGGWLWRSRRSRGWGLGACMGRGPPPPPPPGGTSAAPALRRTRRSDRHGRRGEPGRAAAAGRRPRAARLCLCVRVGSAPSAGAAGARGALPPARPRGRRPRRRRPRFFFCFARRLGDPGGCASPSRYFCCLSCVTRSTGTSLLSSLRLHPSKCMLCQLTRC